MISITSPTIESDSDDELRGLGLQIMERFFFPWTSTQPAFPLVHRCAIVNHCMGWTSLSRSALGSDTRWGSYSPANSPSSKVARGVGIVP